jgi:hypothetical protein
MKRMFRLMFILLVVTSCASFSQEKTTRFAKAPAKKADTARFAKNLKLSLDQGRWFLRQVAHARRHATVHALASLAVNLATIERQSLASSPILTPKALLDEAAGLLAQRKHPNRDEIDLVRSAAAFIADAGTVASDMLALAQLDAGQRGEGSVVVNVRIQNKADRQLDMYIDGLYVGTLAAGEEKSFPTGDGTTYARATDAFGNTVSETVFIKPDGEFTWKITP